MRKFFASLLLPLAFLSGAAAQTVTRAPTSIDSGQVQDLGNGPLTVSALGGSAFVGTSLGSCTVGAATSGAATITCQALPAIPPIVGAGISGAGLLPGMTVASYNSGTGAIGLSSGIPADITAGAPVSFGAACGSSPRGAALSGRQVFYTTARVCAWGVQGGTLLLPRVPTYGYQQNTFNITKANTAAFRNVVNARTRNAIVAFMGDSTMRGVDETASPYSSQYPNAMPMQLAAQMVALGYNAGANNWYGLSGTSLNDYVIRDSRITVGGTAAVGGAVVQGGAGMSMSSATATMTFTPQGACTTADIYTLDSSSFTGAQVAWSVDGGGATNITQAGNNTIRKTTIPLGAAGIHAITLSWVSGANSLYGIDCYNATGGRTEITMRQWGISGGTASDMVLNTGAPSAGRLAQLAAYPADLVVCECGVINSWRNGTAVSAVKANLTTLVQAVKATGANFMFLTPPFDNASAGAAANQNAYVLAMYQVAAEQNVGLIDLRPRWGSFANAVALTFNVASDNVHPTFYGYRDTAANVVAPVLKAVITNNLLQ